jgi:membrane protein implicated in regulation of membrane protease activity
VTTQQTTPIHTDADEIRRIDFSGTSWLAAVLIANAVFVAALILRGWTYADLAPDQVLPWWIGVGIVAAATVLLAWAGCPVIRKNLAREDATKALSIRVGIVGYLVGAAILVLALLA